MPEEEFDKQEDEDKEYDYESDPDYKIENLVDFLQDL
jgi:hypothetical protein